MTKGTSAKSLHKVVYKPDSQSTEEYIIIVNPEEVSILLPIYGFNGIKLIDGSVNRSV